MDILNRDDLQELARKRRGPCVSIYLSTHRAGRGVQGDPIRLKNLLAQAEERLVAAGLRSPEAEVLLEEPRRLLQDAMFWQHQSEGLAMYMSPESFRYYRLPFDFQPLVIVADRFHIKPLLHLVSVGGRFYILALSQGEVRLLHGTRYSVSEVNLQDVPDSLADALKWDDPEKQLQFHTGTRTPGAKGRRPAIFHGHGVASADDPKDYISRYFHKVDKGLTELFAGERVPLVLAAVDYLHPIYRAANTYPRLVDAGIKGNPEALSAEELHRRAWTIVQPLFVAEQEQATARYRQLAGAGSPQASSDLQEVVRAAYLGRVETLLVAVGEQCWGTFDPVSNEIEAHIGRRPADQDLLDFAAIHTLFQGGDVYAAELADVPSGTPLAATFRY